MERSVVINPLSLSDEQFEQIEDLAACNYSPRQIAVYLEVNKTIFKEMCEDPTSEIYRRYQKGILESTAEINLKLLENARNGNITAAQQYEKNRESVLVENLKKKYFG